MLRQASGRAASGVTRTATKNSHRADNAFMGAMQNPDLSEQEEKTKYLHEIVEANPSWVPCLETCLPNGSMERFVKKQGLSALGDGDGATQLGRKVTTRVTKLAKLPKSDMFEV